jgi:glycosyltransferase involved in cell wall biosynthesis
MEYSRNTSIKNNLTIVIPTYNEVNYIVRTLHSIYNQRGIWGTRVIIADNHSNDGTRKVINETQSLPTYYRKKLNIELIDGGTVSVGRNNGAKLVDTKYILFIDGDVVLDDPHTIKNTLDEMEREGLQLLTCKLKSYGNDFRTSLMFKMFNIVNYFISKVTPFAVGTYFMVDRRVFKLIGGFDETLNHSEDYALSKKFHPENFKISNHYVGQDDRRFKKMGYFGMIRLLVKGYQNRNNQDFFKKDVGYWR